jgi:hypothetical protein
MRNNRIAWIILGSVLALIVLVIVILQSQGGYNWNETYAENKEDRQKDPYGVYILLELMHDYFPAEEVILLNESIDSLSTSPVGSNYVFVGNYPYVTDEESEVLMDFIAAGNTAFIASQSLPYQVTDSLWMKDCEVDTASYYSYLEFHWDTLIAVNFRHPDLRLDSARLFQFPYEDSLILERDWAYLVKDNLCDTVQNRIEELGYMNENFLCFVRTRYGEGYLYWYSLPSTLTNIHLTEKANLDYISRLFSHLQEGTIYWDVKRKDPSNTYGEDDFYSNKGLSADHPLRYILSQPPLAIAWYLLLVTSLLFLIFRAKRRQRIIPVLAPKRNTSLAFVRSIGQMYFLQQNHRHLVLQQMQLFLNELRENYTIPITTLDEETIEQLTQKSGGDAEILSRIQQMYTATKAATTVSDDRLMVFYQLLERFRQSTTNT